MKTIRTELLSHMSDDAVQDAIRSGEINDILQLSAAASHPAEFVLGIEAAGIALNLLGERAPTPKIRLNEDPPGWIALQYGYKAGLEQPLGASVVSGDIQTNQIGGQQ